MLKHPCECGCSDCRLSAELTLEIAEEIELMGYYVIVDGCQNGASKNDGLIRSEKKYKIYESKEKK